MTKNRKRSWLLLPLAGIYWLIIYIRNRLFDIKFLHSKEFTLPVICVGNITVGGTGKTPHIEYLIRLLKDNYNIAILSRGYRRKTKDFFVATTDSTVDEIGDEPKQIKQKFPEVTLAVDSKRARGITKLLTESELDTILLDDGFQHRWVTAGLSILVIDYNRPLDSDFIMPVGSLRESASERKRANMIIISKTPTDIKPIEQRIFEINLGMQTYQTAFFTTLKYGVLTPMFRDFKVNSNAADNWFRTNNCSILLVTGIANPKPLLEYLQNHSKDIVHQRFPDHHNFSKKDIQNILKKFESIKSEHKIIISTEKDAIRLRVDGLVEDSVKENFFYLPVEVDFLSPEDKENFDKQIVRFITKDKWKKKVYPKRH